jgi:hypothetical protein
VGAGAARCGPRTHRANHVADATALGRVGENLPGRGSSDIALQRTGANPLRHASPPSFVLTRALLCPGSRWPCERGQPAQSPVKSCAWTRWGAPSLPSKTRGSLFSPCDCNVSVCALVRRRGLGSPVENSAAFWIRLSCTAVQGFLTLANRLASIQRLLRRFAHSLVSQNIQSAVRHSDA